MNKKIGKFKLWQLVLIGAVIGGGLYLYQRGKGTEGVAPGESEVFGTGSGAYGPIDPNTGVPYAFEGSNASGGSSNETLTEFLAKVAQLRENGFFGTPEREQIREEVPTGITPTQLAAEKQAKRAAQKAAAKARNALHKAEAKVKALEHKATQKPKSTGGSAHVSQTHTAPPHPAVRLSQHQKLGKAKKRKAKR